MKKAEAISILATSVRPREAKDRARYDEAVKMAIEALKCSETPKSSERTAKTTHDAQDKDLDWTILSKSIIPNLVPAGVVAGIVQNQLHLEESIHRIKQLTGISIDDLLNLLAQGYELKAPSTQTDLLADVSKKVERTAETAQNTSSSCAHENDVIFRKAAIDALWKALYEYEDETEKQFLESEELDVGEWIGHRIFVQNMNDIDRQTILNLPSAQPEQKTDEWIPISKETNPTKSGWYLVTVHEDVTNDNERFTGMAEFNATNGMWYDIDEPTDMYLRWMPLPAPYRGGEKET